ncbi:MAG: DUF4430 domain-containing protein [Butyrivibrio sp.]|nr:DUF4430 domain-containing protein [Butyrivibrio sp.]
MRKGIMKTAALTAAAVLSAGCLCATAFAEEEEKTVSLRIEGIEGNVCDGEFKTSSATLDGFFKDADAASEDFELTITESEYGAYLAAVNDEAAAAFGGYEGWLFTVNGEDPGVGMSSVEIKDGDSVVLYYADPFGAGFQFPEMDLEKLDEGIISFTSKDTVYDENYNPSTVVNPVSGMTVKWYTGETEFKEYTTDESGAVVIEAELLTDGEHKLEYGKYAENGLPLVLRSAKDCAVTVKKDVEAGDAGLTAALAVLCAAALAAAVTAVCKKEAYEK